ncbi:MAG TPA: hypothetical protein VF240_19390 [Pyrinomonadaceae bacterium]
MADALPQLQMRRKLGSERFRHNDKDLDLTLLDFWRWYASDLVDNTKRGILAEFIVANALGCLNEVCNLGDAYDLELTTGEKIEIKSAAYVQSWYQKKHSPIGFNIRPTRGWKASTGQMEDETKRQADIYIFCLLNHKDKESIDPLNLDQWEFYILSASVLNQACPTQGRIGLTSLERLNPLKASYAEIRPCVEKVAQSLKKTVG